MPDPSERDPLAEARVVRRVLHFVATAQPVHPATLAQDEADVAALVARAERQEREVERLRAALGIVVKCAEARIAELQPVPLGTEGRDIAFRNSEILCGALSFLGRHARDSFAGEEVAGG